LGNGTAKDQKKRKERSVAWHCNKENKKGEKTIKEVKQTSRATILLDTTHAHNW
jgi:hypothetical protein